MAVALNLVALLLVLAFVWAGMVLMSGHYRRKQPGDGDLDSGDLDSGVLHNGDPCPACGGVGAQQRRGALEPCGTCEGTGVLIGR